MRNFGDIALKIFCSCFPDNQSEIRNGGEAFQAEEIIPKKKPASQNVEQSVELSAHHGSYAGRWRQYFATFTVSLAALATGSAGGWPSPMLLLLKSDDSPVGKMSLQEMSLLETLPTVAGLIGICLYGVNIDRFGRKVAGHLVSIPGILGWIILIFASSPYHLYGGRFLTGLSSVGGMLVGAVYLSEVVHETRRGTLMSFFMFAANLGVLLSYVLGDVMKYRWFNIVCTIPLILFPVFFVGLPESPYYLTSISRLEDARSSLLWFRAGNEEVASNELRCIMNIRRINKSCLDLFRSKSTRTPLLILIFMFTFQQLGGSQVVQGYASVIFEDAGNPLPPNTSATLLIAIKLGATYISVLLIDRVGRRILMMAMFLVMSICLTIMAIYFYEKDDGINVIHYSWVPLASLCSYNVATSLGVGTLGEVVGNEIIPTEVKGATSIISGTITLAVMMLCLQVYPFVHDHVGSYANFAYPAVFNFMGCIITYFVLPETRGKTLEEITTYFER